MPSETSQLLDNADRSASTIGAWNVGGISDRSHHSAHSGQLAKRKPNFVAPKPRQISRKSSKKKTLEKVPDGANFIIGSRLIA
jgi:hypothetical protein